MKGPENTPYEGGFYHGKLIFPGEFPFQPPSIYMTTPNGRFKVNTKLCLSISDFHPDTWNPAWSVSTILTGLLSFMVSNNNLKKNGKSRNNIFFPSKLQIENSPTLGSITTTDYEKKHLAAQSLEYNLKDKLFCELFPETVSVRLKIKLNYFQTSEFYFSSRWNNVFFSSFFSRTLRRSLNVGKNWKNKRGIN